jgi:HK97 family phage prohead protease
MEKELRFQSEVVKPIADEKVIEGYAIRYNSPSNPIGGEFIEVVEQGALRNADTSEAYLFYQHNPNDVLASVKAGTLSLRETPQGLWFRAELPNTTLGNDVYELVKRGDLDSMSFGFTIKDDVWDMSGEIPTRKIRSFSKIFELSIVTYPAYEQTQVSARALKLKDECVACKLELNKKNKLYDEAKKILEEVK